MKKLKKEKYKLIFNEKEIDYNIKTIEIEKDKIHILTLAYTKNNDIIIKLYMNPLIQKNTVFADNYENYINNIFKPIDYIIWSYYIELKMHNKIYRLYDLVNDKNEKKIIRTNFTKEQRKNMSILIEKCFKWWFNNNNFDIIHRRLNNKKILMKRYNSIHNYIMNTNKYKLIKTEYIEYNILTYVYINKIYKGKIITNNDIDFYIEPFIV